MDTKYREDFSSYFHFEASGDSEADICEPIMGENACERARVDDDDNDDAMSCSYDGSGACNVADELDGHESCDAAGGDEHDDVDEEKQDVIYGTSYCDEDEMDHDEHYKSYVSFDSSQESVDEMEKNRLFWEACLAS